MTTPKAKFVGLALVAALCAGFTLGLTAPAWAGWDEGEAAYVRGDYATALGTQFRGPGVVTPGGGGGGGAPMAVRPRRGISGVRKEMARPAGLEPTTPRLGIWCSIRLSYGRAWDR